MNKPAISVLRSFQTVVDAKILEAGDFADAVPGGLWTGEVPEGQSLPYGTITVRQSSYEWIFSDSYIEHVEIEIIMYAVGADALDEALNEIEGTFNWEEDLLFPPDDVLIHVYPLPRTTRGEFARDVDGNQVFSGSLGYHVSVWRV